MHGSVLPFMPFETPFNNANILRRAAPEPNLFSSTARYNRPYYNPMPVSTKHGRCSAVRQAGHPKARGDDSAMSDYLIHHPPHSV